MQRCHGCMKEYGKEFDVCPHCGYIAGTLPQNKSHLRGGTELCGRYMVGKVLGYGGFGITYIAWDQKLKRTVAIKEFFPNSLSTRSEGESSVSCYDSKALRFFNDGIKKMLDEGSRLSKFSGNENIVNVYDCFEENNTAYIVMEYLEGKDLKQYLAENGGKLSPEKAVEIILPVLNALEDMHKEKIIHRDIAPDNIFLCGNGKIKLLDFGSARLAVEDSEKSLSVMVKRGYAPKEQYASRSKQGPWTDVYAVCATLYKMITGSLPSESMERDIAPLESFAKFGINGFDELEKVIFKGLEPEISDRIRSVSELGKLLSASVNAKKEVQKAPQKPVGFPAVAAAAAQKTAEKPPAKKSKSALKINLKAVAAVAAAVVVIVGAVFTIKTIKDKVPVAETDSTATSTAQSAVATTEIKTKPARISKDVFEKAMKAYETKLANADSYYSAYVVDINNDSIPEVICRPGEVGMQFAMTYTEKSGLSVIDLMGHSGMCPDVFVSTDNCLYMRDDGHNIGTSFYHHAVIYKIDETGFVKMAEIEGDEPDEFDWENETLFNELNAKYQKQFADKIDGLVGNKTFVEYSRVAVEEPDGYLKSILSADTAQALLNRMKYEDYLLSAQANKYFEPIHPYTDEYNMYGSNAYDGEKQTHYFDLDNDGTEECILVLGFPSVDSLPYDVVYVFDLDEEVRLVDSSGTCGPHRAQEKFAVVETDEGYLIHKYYTDPHELWGTVYSYNGENFDLVWSYDADDFTDTDEDKVVMSTEFDFLKNYEPDYLSMHYDNEELPPEIKPVSKTEFENIYYNDYRDKEVFYAPVFSTWG